MLIEMDYENIKKYFTYSGGKIRPYNSKILPYISNLQRWLDSGNNNMLNCFLILIF